MKRDEPFPNRRNQEEGEPKLHNRVDALKEKLADNHKLSSGWAGELSRLKLPADTDIVALLESTRERLARIEREFDKIDSALSSCQTRREEAGRRAASLKARLEPVSYTHLDVYKRQVSAVRGGLRVRDTGAGYEPDYARRRGRILRAGICAGQVAQGTVTYI